MKQAQKIWPGSIPDEKETVAMCLASREVDINEWLVHHYTHLGVRRFYIMDDRSDQPYHLRSNYSIPREVLTFRYYPTEKRVAGIMQKKMYDDCVRLWSDKHQWMVFIDSDDFLEITTTPGRSLAEVLKNYEAYGALGVVWRQHTSNGHLKKQPDTRHHYFEVTDYEPLFKSTVQTRYYSRALTPHTFQLFDNVALVDEHKRPLTNGMQVNEATTDVIGVHHYAVKSREDFEQKRLLGNAMDQPRSEHRWQLIHSGGNISVWDSFRNYYPKRKRGLQSRQTEHAPDLPIDYERIYQEVPEAINLGIEDTPEKLRRRRKLDNKSSVTRSGHKLFLGGQEYRFHSVACPHLLGGYGEDFSFEVDDTLKTIAAAFPNPVTRTYVFSIVSKKVSAESAHIVGYDYLRQRWQLNEQMFIEADRVLAKAAEYGVRLIIPFINQRQPENYVGDQFDFIQLLYQLPTREAAAHESFYRRPETFEAFKSLITQILNRVNTINGMRWGDDPTVLFWETGNELQDDDLEIYQSTLSAPGIWTAEIAAHIKTLAPHTLVLDGGITRDNGDPKAILSHEAASSPAVDAFTFHAYGRRQLDHAMLVAEAVSSRDKVLIIGELGFAAPHVIQEVFYEPFAATPASGSILWSMRPHSSKGGFVTHTEDHGFFSYHLPGFDSHSVHHKDFDLQESNMITILYNASHWLSTARAPPPFPIPAPVESTWWSMEPDESQTLIFRGSAWAESYQLWTRCSSNKTWRLHSASIDDYYAQGSFGFTISSELSSACVLTLDSDQNAIRKLRSCSFSLVALSRDHVPGLPSKIFSAP